MWESTVDSHSTLAVDFYLRMNEILYPDDTLDFLTALVEHCGGAVRLSTLSGVDESNLRKMVKGKIRPSPRLLDYLGVEEVTILVLPRNLSEWYDSYQRGADEGEAIKHSGEGGGDAEETS